MKTICLYFQIHQPLDLKRYRFFDMGKDHHYLDDASNRTIIESLARLCYIPMNELLLRAIREHKGNFKISFSISGIAVELLREYAPQALEGLKELAKTGCVEFIAETYSHSLASLYSEEEFVEQVKRHSELMESEFGQKATAFRNTELIYSDDIGAIVAQMGFKTMLAEGAKHVLGWKSPNFVYSNSQNKELNLLLRNYLLSDDIIFRFSDRSWGGWPLTAERYVEWIGSEDMAGEVVNLFMDYETFGAYHRADTGIFQFIEQLPKTVLASKKLKFATVSECSKEHKPIAAFACPYPVSWADEERDISLWMGNDLQKEAISKLNALRELVKKVNDPELNHVWSFMQSSNHFYYMATKWFASAPVHNYINPYDSSYNAFINYMNVLSDFTIELKKRFLA